MSTTELRREIKKAVDRLPAKQLESLADYVAFLSQPPLDKQLKEAEEDFAAGRVRNWRQIRSVV
jgi:hypothetical protein